MSKVTSQYQVTIPKSLADRLGVRPGDEIDWRLAGNELRVTPPNSRAALSIEERLASFDEATRRQMARNSRSIKARARGWKRADLYDRGRTR